jgi:alpha-1,3-glucosyltransferase
MLAISATPYASAETVAYQRSTVIAADVLLLLGSAALAAAQSPAPSRADRQMSVTLAFLNGGLLLVDHVHFQYNGMMIGLLLVSVALVATGHERSGALAFAVLLNLKHLFLFAAPFYFIHLLQGFVLRQRSPSIGALRRLVGLGVIVLATFAASLGPFVAIGQLGQLAARLFPFGRGLTHAYWAPNAWALYNVADRAGAAAVARWLPSSSLTTAIVAAKAAAGSGSTAGLVGEGSFLMLPAVGATHAAGLVLLAQLPLLLKTWRVPRPEAFAAGVACCGLAAFAFGYHVHEKAVLPPLLILSVLTPPAPSAAAALHARALLLLTSAGHYALLPLLFEPAEWSVARLLLLAHLWATAEALRQRFGNQHVGLHGLERAYLWGFVLLEAFTSAAHPLLLAPQLPFLPLLLTSVYCALGVLHATGLTYLLWWEYACGRAGGGPIH